MTYIPSILYSLLLEIEVAELKHNQEMILVRLAAIEQFLRDGWEQQLNGARLSPALPGNTKINHVQEKKASTLMIYLVMISVICMKQKAPSQYQDSTQLQSNCVTVQDPNRSTIQSLRTLTVLIISQHTVHILSHLSVQVLSRLTTQILSYITTQILSCLSVQVLSRLTIQILSHLTTQTISRLTAQTPRCISSAVCVKIKVYAAFIAIISQCN